MTNFASHVKDAGLNPDTIPLTFFRKTSGSHQRPVRRHRPPRPRALPGLRGRDRPGDRPGSCRSARQVTAENWTSFVAGLVVTNDVSARDVQLPKTQFYESKSYPTLHPGRAGAGPARRRRAQAVRRPAAAAVGQRRAAPGRGGRRRHDLLPAAGPAGAEPVPAARRRGPAADRDPGGHRPERTAEAGRRSSPRCCRPR